MKKLICLLMALMLMGSALAEVPDFRFGFDALRETCDGTQNQVISPLSLAVAMAMAAQGAEGETYQQIMDVLGFADTAQISEIQEAMAGTGLRQANAAFLAGEMTPKEEYMDELVQMFGAKWFMPEETSVDRINGWVADATDGMIDRMIAELPEELQLVLINAIAMDAKWQISFDPYANGENVFHAPGGDVMVTFMNNEFYADYGERENVQLLRLNYRDCGLTMLIALPEAGGVEAVLDGLCAEGLGYFEFREEPVKVKLSMPRTDISVTNPLTETLQTLGIRQAFSGSADFSGITEEMPLRIDSVLQRARLILDEEGTRAAAVTMISMEATAVRPPKEIVEFRMDRPFAFVIADEISGVVCFAGIVADPVGN